RPFSPTTMPALSPHTGQGVLSVASGISSSMSRRQQLAFHALSALVPRFSPSKPLAADRQDVDARQPVDGRRRRPQKNLPEATHDCGAPSRRSRRLPPKPPLSTRN